MYTAKVIRIRQLENHPNADRLQLIKYNGLQFVVDMTFKPDQLVVLFPTDGQLSHEFCYRNNLYRDATKNDDPTKSGFFEDNRRVRAQPFRKEKSEGFVCHIDAFIPFFRNLKDSEALFVEGYEFTTVGNTEVCSKYVTDATRKAMSGKAKGQSKDGIRYSLPRHFETEQLDFNYDKIPTTCLVVITEKLHGTSGRTGLVKVEREKTGLVGRVINSLFHRKVVRPRITESYEPVSGTRNTICNTRPDVTERDGKEYFRWMVHQSLAPLLFRGETLYYEIVGYDTFGSPLMNPQSLDKIKDKSVLGKWAGTIIPRRQMVYSYNCNKVTGNGLTSNFDVYVYRITQQGDGGNAVELSWFDVQRRCAELGLKTVPVLGLTMFDAKDDEAFEQVKDYLKLAVEGHLTDGPSTIDSDHLMEGVCVRFESKHGMVVFKAKNYLFKLLEGIVKEDQNQVDLEEAS